jgi:hypothetical protein
MWAPLSGSACEFDESFQTPPRVLMFLKRRISVSRPSGKDTATFQTPRPYDRPRRCGGN